MKERLRRNKGITLIALIITVIILIILTAVTINNVIGTDLIGLATKAAENYMDAEKEEEDKISELISKGEVRRLSTLVTENNYGNKIDYPVDLDGNSETNDWKIFYNDGTNVFIIAADYVKNEKTSDARTAAGMSKTNGDYSAYWDSDSLPEFKDSWNTHSTLFMATKYDLSSHNSNPNSQCVSNLLDTTNWDSFIDSDKKYGEYAIGGPTLEMWCDSWNKYLAKKPKEGLTYIKAEETNDTGYYVSSEEQNMQNKFNLYMNGTQTALSEELKQELKNNYSLYFPHTEAYQSCKGYWLASLSAYSNNVLMFVSINGGVSYYYYGNNYRGLRPVVCLKSGVSAIYDSEHELYTLSK